MMTNSTLHWNILIPPDFRQGEAPMTPNHHALSKAEHDYHADPSSESAARALIYAYQQAGRRDDALRVGLRLLLHLDTLNRLPEPATQRLMQSLAAVPAVTAGSRLVSRRSLFAACAAAAVMGTGAVFFQLNDHSERAASDIQRQSLVREADTLAENAAKLYHEGDYDTAYIQAQTAHDNYRRLGLTLGEGKTDLTIGQIFQAWGKYSLAEYWIISGATQIREAGQPLTAAYALNIAANLNIKLGNFEQAQTQNEQSLQIRREADDQAGIIEGLRERGTILAEQGNYPVAEKEWQDAERYARAADKPDMIAGLEYVRGSYAIRQGKSDNGLLESSFRYWKSIKQQIWQANVRLRQAEGDLLQKQYAAAQSKLNFCRSIYKQNKSRLGLADCQTLQGRIFLAKGGTTEAQQQFSQAITFYQDAGLKPRLSQAVKLLNMLTLDITVSR